MKHSFLNNKYTRCYYRIISKAQTYVKDKSKSYYEIHHIIPKSLGGNYKKDNTVLLTAKEHYICHHLLYYMVEGENKSKMLYAFNCFVFGLSFVKNKRLDEFKISSRQYEYQKKRLSELKKGKPFPCHSTMWMEGKTDKELFEIGLKKRRFGAENGFYNKKHSKQSMKQMVEKRLIGGNGDYHHGKNSFKNPDIIKKAILNREKNGNNAMAIKITIFNKKYKSISELSRLCGISYKRLYRAYIKYGAYKIEELIKLENPEFLNIS